MRTVQVTILGTFCLLACIDEKADSIDPIDSGASVDTGGVGFDTGVDSTGSDTGGEWTDMGEGPDGGYHVASIGDRLLAVGNVDAASTTATYEYEASTRKWTNKMLSLNPPNFKVGTASLAGAGGRALLLGGRASGSGACTADAWTYDAAGWKKIAAPAADGVNNGKDGFELWTTMASSGDVLAIGGETCTGSHRTDAWRWNGSSWSSAGVTGCKTPTGSPPTGNAYSGSPIAQYPPSSSPPSVLLIDQGDTWRWDASKCSMEKAGAGASTDTFVRGDWMASDVDHLYVANQSTIHSWSASSGWTKVGTMKCKPFGGGRIAPGRFAFLCPGASGTKTLTWEWAPK